ncbi:MAG: pyrroline-5-carboxylate reductase, partial [Kiloniellaceae bacterium]
MADGKLDIGGSLLLVGCGKMGGALLDGWLRHGAAPRDIFVVEPNPDMATGLQGRGVTVAAGLHALPAHVAPAVIVLAIKPQQTDAAVPGLAPYAGRGGVLLPIVAGRTIGYFERSLGAPPIVRAMPNTPAAVGRGMSVLCANAAASAAQRQVCEALMGAVGEVAWVDDEGLLDAVTAVSGGGPAYVFLLIECLARAGVEAGLPEDLAMDIARATVAGAGELVFRSEQPASTLRRNVTSPAGTTLEALKVLMAEDGLQPLMTRAIAEAT